MTPPAILEHLRLALLIANRAVVSDIETEADRVTIAGVLWYDTTPMADPREHSPEFMDMNREALRYAVDSGLVVRHPERAHLVRIATAPAA